MIKFGIFLNKDEPIDLFVQNILDIFKCNCVFDIDTLQDFVLIYSLMKIHLCRFEYKRRVISAINL